MANHRDDMTPAEFAKAIGHDCPMVDALIRTGEVTAYDHRQPGSKLPRYRIPASEVEGWLERRRVVPQLPEPANPTGSPRPLQSVPCLKGVIRASIAARQARQGARKARMAAKSSIDKDAPRPTRNPR